MNKTIWVLIAALAGFGCVNSGSNSDGDVGGYTDTDSFTESDADSSSDTDESSGCDKDPTGIAQKLDVEGQERTFELYLPDDYNPSQAYPLIFGFHGGGGTGAWSQSYWGLDEEVGSDAIVVYPDGLVPLNDKAAGWDLDPENYDFDFFDALLSHLKTNLCIDEARVFSTGFSWGAYMSNSLGCYRSDVLAAFASVAGGMPGAKPPAPAFPDCAGKIAAWIVHGTVDYTIPLYAGEEIRDIFLENNGCQQTTSSIDPDPCVSYDGCNPPVHWCQHGGGHDWPDFVSEGSWQFFSNQ